METQTEYNDAPDSKAVLEGQLRECFGRVVYTHKTQEKCADILLLKLSTIKYIQIGLSALTTGGFVSVVLGLGQPAAVIGAVVSSILLALNAYTKDYNLGEISQKHRHAAADLWFVREKYLSLLTDLRIGDKSVEKIQKERDVLLEELHSVYSGAPSTTFNAYKKAQKALKHLEDMTFSDEEIDVFLPKELKRGN